MKTTEDLYARIALTSGPDAVSEPNLILVGSCEMCVLCAGDVQLLYH